MGPSRWDGGPVKVCGSEEGGLFASPLAKPIKEPARTLSGLCWLLSQALPGPQKYAKLAARFEGSGPFSVLSGSR